MRASLGRGIGAIAVIVAVPFGCGSRSGIEECRVASLGCACLPGDVCAPGLQCELGLCLPGASAAGRPSDASIAGAAGLTGGAGTTGPAGAAGRWQSSFGGRSGEGGAVQIAGAASGGTSPGPSPAVLVLLDGSYSMFDRQVWSPTYEALTGPGGPIDEFQDRIRFGFASYRGTARTTEEDPACAEITRIGFAPRNLPAVRDTYEEVGNTPLRLWETPTAHALTRVMELFATEPATTVKGVLLISDGAPDTCATTNPQCGQDRAIFAVQSAARAGIATYPIGIGFGDIYPGCSSENARCGADHFQDIANAGLGLPVVAPPVGYTELPCTAEETGGKLLASYAPEGGTAPLYWTSSPQDVADAVRKVLATVLAASR